MRASVIALVALPLLLLPQSNAAAEVRSQEPLDKQTREVAILLRCPVCQGESVFDSRASLAVEMKEIIREQLAEGRSPEQILSYFQARYGDFVLMEAPRRGANWLIWLGPLVLLSGGALLLTRRLQLQAREGRRSALERPKPAGDWLDQLERLEP
jgi:cytochrome c-type biogenesis protein CcmH